MATRQYMELDLRGAAGATDGSFAAVSDGIAVRPIVEADFAELGRLMVDAYRGTIDYEGESAADAEAEIAKAADGAHGEALREVWLAAAEESGRLISAVFCTRRRGVPFVAFMFTHPSVARRGIAGTLIRQAASRLAATGESALGLWVTIDNPARLLYQKLGFRAVAEPPACP